jgi:hypothetical protein
MTFPKNVLLAPLLFIGVILLSPFISVSQSVDKLPVLIINEIDYSKQSSDGHYIELLVVSVNEIPQVVTNDKAEIIIDDTNVKMPGSSSDKITPGFISLKPELLSDASPGDLIVIHGSGVKPVTNDPNVKLLSINSDFIEVYAELPNANNPNYDTSNPNYEPNLRLIDYVKFDGLGDISQVKVGGTYSSKIELNNNDQNYSFTNFTSDGYSNLTPTLGVANNPENDNFIKNLRKVNVFDISCSQHSTGTHGLVEIMNGEPPFDVIVDGEMHLENTNSRRLTTPKLLCGEHAVEVIDAEGISLECSVVISSVEEQYLTICSGDTFIIPYSECDQSVDDCISLSINDEPGEIITLNQLNEPLDINGITKIVLTITTKGGKVKQQFTYHIKLVSSGDSCDDGDVCTDNDRYNEQCECKGVSIGNFRIINKNLGGCDEIHSVLTVAQDFDSYTWYYKQLYGEWEYVSSGSDENEIEVLLPGQYKVQVEVNGYCLFEQVTAVYDFNSIHLNISSTKEALCREYDETVLSIPDGFLPKLTEITWYEYGSASPLGTSPTLTVSQAGIYKAVFYNKEGCKATGIIEVRSALDELRFSPENPIICDAAGVLLEIKDLPADYKIKQWSYENIKIPDYLEDNLIASESGVYKVQIESDGCFIELEIKVNNKNDFNFKETIGALLLAEGFECINVRVGLPALKDDEVVLEKNGACDRKINNDYQVVFPDGSESKISEYLEKQIPEFCSCNVFDYGIMYTDDLCQIGFDLDELINFSDSYDKSVTAYLLDNTLNGSACLYVKKNLGENCDGSYNKQPVAFTELINAIVCGLHAKEDCLALNIDPGSVWIAEYDDIRKGRLHTEFWGSNQILYSREVLNHPSGLGAHVINYKRGKLIQLSPIWYNISSYRIPGCSKDYTGDFFAVDFPYKKGNNTCPDIDDGAMTIIVGKNDEEKLRRLFRESTFSTLFSDLITEGEKEALKEIPGCLIGCTQVQELLDRYLNDGYKSHLLDLLSLEDIPEDHRDRVAECMILYLRDENLVKPYLDIFGGYSQAFSLSLGPRLQLLSRISDLAFDQQDHLIQPSENSLPTIRLEGSRFFVYGTDFYSVPNETGFSVSKKYRDVLDGITLNEYAEFNYLDLYNVRIDKKMDYKKLLEGNNGDEDDDNDNVIDTYASSDGFDRQRANATVPGIHILHTVEKKNNNEALEDANNLLNVALIPSGFAGISNGLRSLRMGQLTSRLGYAQIGIGSADIVTGTSHLLLDDEFICANSDNWFCNEYKNYILPIVDVTLLSGSFKVMNMEKVVATRNEFMGSGPAYTDQRGRLIAAIKAKKPGKDGDDMAEIFIKLMTNPDDLWRLLKELIGDVGLGTGTDDFFKLIVSELGVVKSFHILELGEEISKLNVPLKKQFLDDLIATKDELGTIGYHVDHLSENSVNAFNVLRNSQHRLKIGSIQFFSDPAVLATSQSIIGDGIPGRFPNIPIEELTAIAHYTTEAYIPLNAALRGSGDPGDYFNAFEELLNDGLNKLPDFNGNVVYRGVKGGESTYIKDFKKGENVPFSDFKSTSTSTNVAGDFAGDVIYEITNPKGKLICDISCLPESEVLFNSNSTFLVEDIIMNFVIYNSAFEPKTVTKYILKYIN